MTSANLSQAFNKHYSRDQLFGDINRLRSAWKEYRRTPSRSAIFKFLQTVLELVTIWKADGQVETRTRRAMAEGKCPHIGPMEPFGFLVRLAAHPKTIDRRTVAKWSRVLRYAERFKLPGRSMRRFVKKRGGINECASRFTKINKKKQNRSLL